MNTRRVTLFLCLLTLLLSTLSAQTPSASSAAAGRPRVVMGIAPVFDANGLDFSPHFIQHITYIVYRTLLSRGDIQPVLINPGGVYDPAPGGDEWTVGYARKIGVDAVLVTSFLPLEKTNKVTFVGNRPQGKMLITVSVLDAASGRRSPIATLTQTDSLLDIEAYSMTTSSIWTGALKEFDKQKKGRVAHAFAEKIIDYVDQQLPVLGVQGSGSEPVTTPSLTSSCAFSFSIRYLPRNVNSMAYSLIVNGREESAAVKDGVAHLHEPVGPMLIQSDMQDTPHRMTPQRYYQANTVFHCSPQENNLVLELGVAGDAQLLWEP